MSACAWCLRWAGQRDEGCQFPGSLQCETEYQLEVMAHAINASKIGVRRQEPMIELERNHDLAPRRWRLPAGKIIGEAVNREAIELLKSDPDEYFHRTRRRPVT
jgi:hypothetical protein